MKNKACIAGNGKHVLTNRSISVYICLWDWQVESGRLAERASKASVVAQLPVRQKAVNVSDFHELSECH